MDASSAMTFSILEKASKRKSKNFSDAMLSFLICPALPS